jgi:AraC-like DNA-binding protein
VFFFHDGESYGVFSRAENLTVKVICFSNCFYFPFSEKTVSFFDIPYVKRKIYTQIDTSEFAHFKYMLSTLEQHSVFFTSYNRFTIITTINFILLHYMVVTDGSVLNVDFRDNVGKALRYIYDKFKSSDFTIGELAQKLHFTPTYISKLFKREMGTTPQLYLLNVRLEYAADLLIGGDLSIADVASTSGFNSTAYFIKQFKKKYGQTPKKYARDMKSSGMPRQ